MRTGTPFVIDMDTLMIDFMDEFKGADTLFPTETIFNWEEWRKPENYMKIVKEEEKFDM